MSFVFEENDDELHINWQDTIPEQLNNNIEIKNVYVRIIINGKKEKFDQYLLINRSKNVVFIDCTIDLSQFQCQAGTNITFKQCKCNNMFLQNIQISKLQICDSDIQVEQLKMLQLTQLQVDISHQEAQQFDFQHSNFLECKLHQLYLKNMLIDFTQWSGKWHFIYLENCQFINCLQHDALYADILEISLYDNISLTPIQNIICDDIHIILSLDKTEKEINLLFQNQAKSLVASLESQLCDFSKISSNFTELELINCEIIKSDKTILNFENTDLKIYISDQINLDMLVLQQMQFRHLLIDISDQSQSFQSVLNCSPDNLIFTNCTINLSEFDGFWKSIEFIECVFITTTHFKLRTDYLKISESELASLINFESKTVVLSDIPEINCLPDSNKLIIKNSSLSLIQECTYNIQHIMLKQCTLNNNFSLQKIQKILSINITNSKYNVMLNQYVRRKNQLAKYRVNDLQRLSSKQQILTKKQQISSIFQQHMTSITNQIFQCLQQIRE
ncbi:Hypothetical_protein [Hexamita inflata]|uniref:Hypothetical_protein n=1 Tax=Hexamita inflata TaxID=28002 RepID=A0AA86V512_9EUKA|nr:Hypothetical protein HINF_LOCUS64202 [Hexamita inflata]